MTSESLLRYAAGDATREEAAAVAAWAQAAPENARELRTVVAAWEAATSQQRPEGAHLSSDWRRIEARLHDDAAANGDIRETPARRNARANGAGVSRGTMRLLRAAGIALLLAGGVLFALQRDTPPAAVAAAESHETVAGETRTIALPDGSRAILGPSSRLVVPAAFGDDHRRLELQGTAVFDVTADPGRPFSVAAGGVRTTVLGTEFVVRAYAEDDAVDVAVVHGRVTVQAATAIELEAGERAHVEGGVVHVALDDAGQLLAWRDRRLDFRDATLRQVARELERWYDVAVTVAEERLAERRITMSMPAAALDEVLALLEASLDVEVERVGTRVRFGP